ncbi:MAG: nucleotidyltransferase family protein [Rhodobacteraceae bacterium]|nr:nucleotidyltransferase family protein [Paracoccaceae bacterium]
MGGADKLAMTVGGTPLLRRTALAALASGQPVYVALPVVAPKRRALLAGLDVEILALPEAAEGIGGSIRGGLSALPVCARFMILPADMPLLGADELNLVLQAGKIQPDYLAWRGATQAGKPGHPVMLAAALRPKFMVLKGDIGGGAILRAQQKQTCQVPLPGNAALLDLDTPDDWRVFNTQH